MDPGSNTAWSDIAASSLGHGLVAVIKDDLAYIVMGSDGLEDGRLGFENETPADPIQANVGRAGALQLLDKRARLGLEGNSGSHVIEAARARPP
jgi:hypothetical protein